MSLFHKQTENNSEIHNWAKCREHLNVGYPTQTDKSRIKFLYPRLGEHYRKGISRIVRARGTGGWDERIFCSY